MAQVFGELSVDFRRNAGFSLIDLQRDRGFDRPIVGLGCRCLRSCDDTRCQRQHETATANKYWHRHYSSPILELQHHGYFDSPEAWSRIQTAEYPWRLFRA